MENDKYFTPDIEDIHAGYECELLIFDKWEPNIVKSYTELRSVDECIKDKVIRVSYLTKEQIEAEGWEYIAVEIKGEFIESNMSSLFINKDKNYMLGYNYDLKKIDIVIRDPNLPDMYGKIPDYRLIPRFNGTCKDINTFRKIIKLLGI